MAPRTGRRPFEGLTEVEILHKIIEDDPPSPAWFKPGLPRESDPVICWSDRCRPRYAAPWNPVKRPN